MADIFPYVLLVAAVAVAVVVVVLTMMSSIRNRLRRGRRERLGPGENGPGRSADPHAPQDLPDPQGWTWLQGRP
jgi:hypothetical protein